jgi:hypothetical protein
MIYILFMLYSQIWLNLSWVINNFFYMFQWMIITLVTNRYPFKKTHWLIFLWEVPCIIYQVIYVSISNVHTHIHMGFKKYETTCGRYVVYLSTRPCWLIVCQKPLWSITRDGLECKVVIIPNMPMQCCISHCHHNLQGHVNQWKLFFVHTSTINIEFSLHFIQ